jgi:hypothetical protein
VTFASFTPLLPVALFMTLIQAPTPAMPPTPTPPTPPAAKAETLAPKDPASMVPLLDALLKAQDTKSGQQQLIDAVNKKLQQLGAEMQQDEVQVQAQIDKVKKENGWGSEVQFDRESRKFEKVGAGTKTGLAKPPVNLGPKIK